MSKQPKTKTYIKLAYYLLPAAGCLNLVLPFVLKTIANHQLKKMTGYSGRVSRLRLSMLGNKLTIKGLQLEKEIDGKNGESFFTLAELSLRLDRSAMRRGFILGEVALYAPKLKLVKQELPPSSSSSSPTATPLASKTAIIIKRADIVNGELEYLDEHSSPKVQVKAVRLDIKGKNLSNYPNPGETLPAEVDVTAGLMEGTIKVNLKADLSQHDPTFDLNAEVRNVNLTRLNDFFKAYGKFDVNDGTLSLFTEVAARDRKFEGYVKPEIFDLDILGPEDYNKNFMRILWQGALGAVTELIENHKSDEVATKIPLSGKFTAPHTNVWFAALEIFYNAFVEALRPSIDHEININSVKKG